MAADGALVSTTILMIAIDARHILYLIVILVNLIDWFFFHFWKTYPPIDFH